MIKRPIAIFGISYFIALVAAAYLSPVSLLLPAAFFMVLLCIYRFRKRGIRYFVLVLSGISFALLVHLATICGMVNPVQRHIGESGHAVVTVMERDRSYQDGMSRGTLLIESWNGGDESFRVYCAAFPEMEPGERAELSLTLDEVDTADKLYLYADKVYLSAEFTGKCRFLEDGRALWMAFYRLRTKLSQILRRYLSGEGGAVAAAMVLGDKTRLSYAVRKLFRRAGLSHLLVVSGLHVNLLCAMFWHRKNGKARLYRLRALASILVALLLVCVTGFTPSVCRAGVTAVIYYIGMAFNLPSDGLTSIAVSSLLLCTGNGFAVCDLGLQLSFAATMGLIWWNLIHETLSFNWLVKHVDEEETRKLALKHFLVFRVGSAILGPTLVSVALTPVLLLNGYALNGAAVPANILTIWLVPYILAFGYLVTFAGHFPVLHFLYRGCSLLLELCVRLLLWLCGICAALPFANYALPAAYACFILALLGALVWFAWYRKKARWLAVSIPLCLAAALSAGSVLQRNTVEIALVGNRAYPCVVATENGDCAVLFRGGAFNVNALERYLDRKAIHDVNYVIDIRQEPGAPPPNSNETIAANEHNGKRVSVLQDVSAEILSQKGGNLVVLSVDDWQLAVSAGKPALDKKAAVDLYAVGGTIPHAPAATAYITRSAHLEPDDTTQIFLGESYPSVEIRPGKSIRYKGGKWLVK